jgi:hypothetical protein
MAKQKSNYNLPFSPTELPTGAYYGALPERIIIQGVEWVVTKTGTVNGETVDKIKNINTNEMKVLKRKTLIKYLEKEYITNK